MRNSASLFVAAIAASLLAVMPRMGLAQTKATVTGIVNDDKGIPIQGATVASVAAGKNITTVSTDSLGRFRMTELPTGEYSFNATMIGFEPQTLTGYTLKEGKTTSILISLVPQPGAMTEVVVVGYGTQKKANLTGAVSSVKMDEVLRDRPVTSTSQALQGTIPGVQVTYGSGQPGTGTSINIRGFTSINGSSGPLVLVDNVPMSMDDVNPKDIANISVLKDAAASAIYGARAAFGVVLITTKKGGRNQPIRFEYSNNFAITEASTLPQKTTPLQFVSALNDFGTKTAWTGQDIATWLDLLQQYQQDPGKYPEGFTSINGTRYPLQEHDLYGALFKKGFEQIHNLSFSGGSEKTSFRTSIGYTDQDGILVGRNDTYKRYNFNSFINTSLTSNLTASVNAFYYHDLKRTPANYGTVFSDVVKYGSFAYTDYGTLPGSGEQLPYSSANNIVTNQPPENQTNDNLRLFGKLEYRPIKNLKINMEYTYNYSNQNIMQSFPTKRYIQPENFQLDIVNPTSSYKRASSTTFYNALNLYADYSVKIHNAHDINIILGTNQEQSKQNGYTATRLDLIAEDVPSLSTSTGLSTTGDDFNEFAVSGYFGRINYAYKNKYLLELVARYDGSSRFPAGHRFGFFPAFSAGWVLSEERFMSNQNVFQLLKLRGSFGEIGNQVVLLRDNSGQQDYYPAIPGLPTQNSGWINPSTNVLNPTLSPPTLVSNNFTWERVQTTNLGLDFGVLNNKLGGTFEVYRRRTLGMLIPSKPLPATLGTTPPLENAADLKTDGWEAELSWRDQVGKVRYSLGLNVFNNQATITRYDNPGGILNINGSGNNTYYYVGQKLGEIWGYVTQGYYVADDFVSGVLNDQLINNRTVAENGGLKPGVAPYRGFYQNPGDIRYRDLNGDGVIFTGNNTLADPGDRKIIGDNTRHWQFGVNGSISYANFDFSFFLQGVGKRDLWISNQVFWPYISQFAQVYAHQLDYWTPDNQNAHFPRLYPDGSGNGPNSRLIQTQYLSNAAYMRLKNIGLAYTFPEKWASRASLRGLRVFFSGENLFTFDHLPDGLDAEATNLGEGGIYPFLKKYSFGITVNF
ncbi:hypothetical protein A8C56_06150 [Niabella ginsenosidivorans]|uniref:TonB-dependent receptor plug domain-containing protein n=1 Tax=Niabella ginsenosidivorans TaxID=1176587 RepID=A0A1A9I0M0_9BACT|nr:TonB-dependent receptor [Niabella ginsenosidivorans]ANH80619.1 hypothetical protein A8C56_06150 [Niabella ginsenosidivorans]